MADNELVLRAKLISKHLIVAEGDPEGIDGWIYHFDVITSYRSGRRKSVAIYSSNTTSRVLFEKDVEYFVFASTNIEGMFEAGNYCDKYTEAHYSKALEEKIKSCIKARKK